MSAPRLLERSFGFVHLGAVVAAASGKGRSEVVTALKSEHGSGGSADQEGRVSCDSKGVHHTTWDGQGEIVTWGELADLLIAGIGNDPALAGDVRAWQWAWSWLNTYIPAGRRGKQPAFLQGITADDPEHAEWWWPTYCGLTGHLGDLQARVTSRCVVEVPEQERLFA